MSRAFTEPETPTPGRQPRGATGVDVIRTDRLSKSYGTRIGIANLDLRVPAGSVFGFIGPNGAGKTTAIRLLTGFLRADSGSAQVLGLDCARQSHEIKRDVGYVPGDLRLHRWMNGTQALRISGRARGIDLLPAGQRLADDFELDLGVRVREMSRGMRQKLGLILALAHAPRVLILDEPTTALDPITQGRLYRHLRAVAHDGATVFFSSHVLSEVEDLCDRVAIVREGRLVADESVATLRESARRKVTIRRPANTAIEGAPPSGFIVLERTPTEWRGELNGPVTELIEWLQGQPLQDLTITEPDLDSLFLRYYREGNDDAIPAEGGTP